jgi:hypothetical protein
MSIPTTITPAIVDTILEHLAPHFLLGAGNDLLTARQAASQMLAAYAVETDEELRLAAEVVSFGFHALEALSEAAAADLSLNKKLRLRGSAVSLSREAHKSQRKLDQLQRARLTASRQPEAQPPPLQPQGVTREPIQTSTQKGGPKLHTPSRQQRRAARRIGEIANRNAAHHEASMLAAIPPGSAIKAIASHQGAM